MSEQGERVTPQPSERDDAARARRHLTVSLQAEGRQWPALCAAVLVTRAVLGLDRLRFAAALGIAPLAASSLETGGCAPGLAPPRLADLAPDVDWWAMGVPLTRERSPTVAHHPAAHRPGRVTW
ncbi:MAG: hypothetical protein QOF97_3001 [Acidimicrobiaceae bacterium]